MFEQLSADLGNVPEVILMIVNSIKVEHLVLASNLFYSIGTDLAFKMINNIFLKMMANHVFFKTSFSSSKWKNLITVIMHAARIRTQRNEVAASLTAVAARQFLKLVSRMQCPGSSKFHFRIMNYKIGS